MSEPVPASIISHLNLRKLIPIGVSAAIGAAVSHYKEQGELDWFPDWGFDVVLLVTLLFGVYWLWTQPDVRSILRLIYDRRPKMLMPVLIIVGVIIGGSMGAFGAWRIKRYWQHQEATQASQQTVGPTVEIETYLAPDNAPYPKGTVLGGISWEDRYTDVRLDIANGLVPIQNLDLTIALDTHIEAIGQLSQLPNLTVFPLTRSPAIWLGGTDEKGSRVTLPVNTTVSGPAGSFQYRIHCPTIFSDSTLQLVVAAVAINAPSPKGELPKQLFAPKRAPQSIRIKGSYDTLSVDGTKTYPIDFSYTFVPVAHHAAKTPAASSIPAKHGSPATTSRQLLRKKALRDLNLKDDNPE